MAQQKIISCLWFNGKVDEALALYKSVFPSFREGLRSYYPEEDVGIPDAMPGKILTQDFSIHGHQISLLNAGPHHTFNPSTSFMLHFGKEADLRSAWEKLGKGGTVRMALDAYPWAPLYGWTTDAFGVEWQLNLAPEEKRLLAPTLLFVDERYGKAIRAIERYKAIFKDSEIVMMARNPDEKHVDFCSLTLAGTNIIIMDGAGEHNAPFNDAFSLQIFCKDQKEMDYYWEELGKGGEFNPCGWVKDEFGFSWQVVPEPMSVWLQDKARATRIMAELMTMKKLDWKRLENA